MIVFLIKILSFFMESTDMAIAIEIASCIPSGIATISKHSTKIMILIVSSSVSFEKSDLSPLKLMWKML